MDYKEKVIALLNSQELSKEQKETLENIFPELKESEDEKMIQYFKDLAPFDKADELYEKYGFSHKDAIAWLESKDIKNKVWIYRDVYVREKEHARKDGIDEVLANPQKYGLEKQGEQKPANTDFSDLRTWKYIVDAVWTEKEGIGQYLDSPFTEEIAKKLQKRFGNIEQKSAWSEEDEKQLNDAIDACKAKYGNMSYTADWLKSLKDRVVPQQKHEWSEDDEQMMKEAVDAKVIPADLDETQFCLSDYDEVSYVTAMVKAGKLKLLDKVKLVIVKED